MDKIYIFDVDGTLTPSRRKMTKDFKKYFEEWTKKNQFYLVTGSDLPKLQEQMDFMDIVAEAIFTCCGNQMWIPDPHIVNISENKFTPPETLIDYLKEQLDNSKYHHRAGNHIEDRGSLLNFSIVGRNCSLMERENYFKWDKETKERRKIAKGIEFGWSGLDAVLGGQISIDIYPKGHDKSQILSQIKSHINLDSHTKTLADTYEYIFIGDRIEEGGNDYPLAKLMDETDNCSSYHTTGWKQTQKILEELND
jgi:phosphomannomutase